MIEQQAGKVAVRAYTDGSPVIIDLTILANNGDDHMIRTRIATLHDLRYCIDRVLAQLGSESDG